MVNDRGRFLVKSKPIAAPLEFRLALSPGSALLRIPRYSLIQRIGNGDKNRSYAKKESPKHARKISGKEKSEMKNNIARL